MDERSLREYLVQHLHQALGFFSIACWIVVFSPQLWTNYRRKSGESLSLLFLYIWLVGDVFCVVGLVLSRLETYQIALAAYYAIVDGMLIAQVYYYRAKAVPYEELLVVTEEKEDAGEMDDDHPSEQYSTAIDPRGGTASPTNHHHHNHHVSNSGNPPNIPDFKPEKSGGTSAYGGRWFDDKRLGMAVVVLVAAVGLFPWAFGSRLDLPYHVVLLLLLAAYHQQYQQQFHRIMPLPLQTWLPLLGATFASAAHLSFHASMSGGGGHSSTHDKDAIAPGVRIFASICGYTSAILYVGSRLPQIIKNHMARSCEGLSPWLFVFSVLGNSTYVGAIFTEYAVLGDGEKLRDNVPYILGSAGTLLFDLMIFFQFYLYHGGGGGGGGGGNKANSGMEGSACGGALDYAAEKQRLLDVQDDQEVLDVYGNQ